MQLLLYLLIPTAVIAVWWVLTMAYGFAAVRKVAVDSHYRKNVQAGWRVVSVTHFLAFWVPFLWLRLSFHSNSVPELRSTFPLLALCLAVSAGVQAIAGAFAESRVPQIPEAEADRKRILYGCGSFAGVTIVAWLWCYAVLYGFLAFIEALG
jgi:hypothetical protein